MRRGGATLYRTEPRYGAKARKKWFRDLDSNQDTQLQRLMSYRLDDPGMAEEIVAEGCKGAQAVRQTERRTRKIPAPASGMEWRVCAGSRFLLNC